MNKITQFLSPFDENKFPYEGVNFRENAAYAWTWQVQAAKEQNIMFNQANALADFVNSKANTISSQSQQISSYLEEIKKEKAKTQEAASSAAITKQEINEKLENIDITGTAGYTADTINDLLSRNRNMHFVGANII